MMFAVTYHPRNLCFLAVSLALTGCTLGPDYQRPALALPAQHLASTDSATPEIRREWWQLFNDPNLNELIEATLKNNPDIKQAIARVDEAEALVREAGGGMFPELNANGNVGHSRSSQANATPVPTGTPVVRKDSGFSLSTAFELDFWGKLRRADEAARAQAMASRFAQSTTELTLTGLVAKSYFTLRMLEGQVQAAEDSLDTRRRGLAIAEARLQAGSTSRLEVQQAESAVAAQRAQVSSLIQQRDLAKNQLAILTGRLDLTVATTDLASVPLPPTPPAGLPSHLLDARPDVREAEANLVAANARIGVVKAALFPSISLTAAVGSQSKDLSNLFESRSGTWSTSLLLSLPVFDGGKGQARVDQATARQRQALAAYERAVQAAFRDINDALVSARESAIADDAITAQQASAKRTLALTEARYQAGLTPPTEVLEARRNLNETRSAWLRSRQTRLSAVVDILKALGGGWKS